ncbi:MAG TPA: regulatory protein RecX [Puia sp.]|jgi:regulatory protein|nr:regulatory protein RecX [Puia sp.]
MLKRSTLSREQALQKARHYCGYQDRCHQEVKEKLYSLGLRKQDVETTIATLIEEDYLSEERFAVGFASGHFRLKQWGRIKIRYELKKKQVGEYCINKALALIEEDEYAQTLNRVGSRKWEGLGEETNPVSRQRKLQEYLLQKGYEPDRVKNLILQLCPRSR